MYIYQKSSFGCLVTDLVSCTQMLSYVRVKKNTCIPHSRAFLYIVPARLDSAFLRFHYPGFGCVFVVPARLPGR